MLVHKLGIAPLAFDARLASRVDDGPTDGNALQWRDISITAGTC